MVVKMPLLILILSLLGITNSESISTLSAADEIMKIEEFELANYDIDDIMNKLMENKSSSFQSRKKRGDCDLSQMYGGNGGKFFQDPCAPDNIGGMIIRSGGIIDSIKVIYRNDYGQKWTSRRHGGKGGEEHELTFNQYEHIVAVVGFYGSSRWCNSCINKLGFITEDDNGYQRKHGPFGQTKGNLLYYEDEVGGFYGRAGKYLNALGFLSG